MGSSVAKYTSGIPKSLRQPVVLWFERLAEQGVAGDCVDDFAERIAKFVACSEFAGKVLLREWAWFTAAVAEFDTVGDERELRQFVSDTVAAEADIDELKSRLRRFRNRYLLRVLWREVHGLADLDETLQQLSALADRLLEAATRIAERDLVERCGRIIGSSGEAVPLLILGMGKLGGRELNFSSDIDLIFCYPEGGQSDGKKGLSAQEYFGRLALKVIALLDETTVDGFVFRVDTRLRPFGDSGPPVVSFAALESYLLQHGRDWERYAYVKARVVGVRPGATILTDLYANLIQPFVYRRYLDYGVFESLREMQAMIATEVRRRELVDNIKLGPGGIREAEFIVQALQLVRGGSEPDLQGRELQVVLPKLVSNRGLTIEAAQQIRQGYRFLRRLENFIQAIRDQQDHDLPTESIDRARLCLAMGYASWNDLMHDLSKHRGMISRQFSSIAFRGGEQERAGATTFGQLWETNASAEEWSTALDAVCAHDSREIAQRITQFAATGATQQADAVSKNRLQRFVPALMERVVVAERPLVALTRTLAVVERILRRSAYLALLNENQAALSRLIDLCEHNKTIADQMARYPILMDELLDPRSYSDDVSKDDLVGELQQRLQAAGGLDSEQQMQVIAQFQRATMFRIAIADVSDRLPIMKVSDALTWLAETVLDETLRVAWRDLSARHGVPKFVLDGITHEAGFGVVGYGKLGGLELSYGSDLDIVFLHDSSGDDQVTDGDKPLDNAMFFARLVRRLVHFLTTQTESGELYEIDTRLRPDGRSGMLVTNVAAFELYQEENAWTWEHQALLRARAIAGDADVLREFERIRRDTLLRRVNRTQMREDVISMRARMRKELDRSSASVFDLKHGRGGIGDVEFLVQFLVLSGAATHPNLIRYSDNIRQLDALIDSACVDATAAGRLQETYRHYRLQQHRLVLDGKAALIAHDQFQTERDFVAVEWDKWLG